MLVLTRKPNQSIMIGDDIEVSVLSIMGQMLRIGIQPPPETPALRKEVSPEIQQERTTAGTWPRGAVDDAPKRLTDRCATASRSGVGAKQDFIRAASVWARDRAP